MVRTDAIFSCFKGASLVGLITSFTAYSLGSEPDNKTKEFIVKIKRHPGIAVLMLTNHWLSLHEIDAKTKAQKTLCDPFSVQELQYLCKRQRPTGFESLDNMLEALTVRGSIPAFLSIRTQESSFYKCMWIVD